MKTGTHLQVEEVLPSVFHIFFPFFYPSLAPSARHLPSLCVLEVGMLKIAVSMLSRGLNMFCRHHVFQSWVFMYMRFLALWQQQSRRSNTPYLKLSSESLRLADH